MSRNIVTAVDGSEHADYAFNWLLDNIAKEGDTIHIVHIYPSPKLPSLSFAEGFTLPVHEWEREIKASISAARAVAYKYQDLAMARKTATQIHLDHGSAGELICKVADEVNADSIVMGSRGLGKVSRMFVGSTSDYVLHHANIPVTIVRNKDKK